MERIDNNKEQRLKGGDVARSISNRPHQFRYRHTGKSSIIIIPIVSSSRRDYIPMGLLPSDTIILSSAAAIYNSEVYVFSIISSLIHMLWVRLTSGKLRGDIRYLSALSYNTFPFPTVTDDQKKHIEHLAEEILLTREDFAGETLAKLYDPDTMPEPLKIAHQNLDDAVDKLYHPKGFADTASRLAHLLERYESLINTEKKQAIDKKAKKAKVKKE